jgi:type III pantothenate kinase
MSLNCIVVNQGNTSTKWGVFEEGKLTATHRTFDSEEETKVIQHLEKNDLPFFGISVCDLAKQENLFQRLPSFTRVNREIMPNHHYTQGLPGEDRLVNLAGAALLYPGQQFLVIDFGTCITYTIGTDTSLLGGAISPGVSSRLKAMHEYTGNLPLVSFSHPDITFGNSTEAAMRAGVYFGILGEIKMFIDEARGEYPHSQVVFTGSDAAYFAERSEYRIFAEEKLTLFGIYALAQRLNLSL